jgi:acetylornithine deacetylase
MEYKIDSQYIIHTLADLVRINSVNPSLSPGGKGEDEIDGYVADSLADLGLSVATIEIEPGRVNVVGVLQGAGEGRSLLLNAHMDTVGVEDRIGDPVGAEIWEDRLYGRGAQDMKGGLAPILGAAKALVDGGISLGGDLLVTAVADEEYNNIGAGDLAQHVTADGAIVTEPTDMSLSRAHGGYTWYDVETVGWAPFQ